MEMTDPHDGLNELQKALDNKLVQMTQCELHPEINFLFDRPNEEYRFSYARIEGGKIIAFCVLVLAEPLEGRTCLGVGYAVPVEYRNQGFATDILTKAIDEFSLHTFNSNDIDSFYLEAIVSRTNIPSQKVVSKVFNSDPRECTDSFSGEPAYSYTKLINKI
ncbi:hypothetical protein THMIRHAS_00290 [Thiosulfatimonas sediminis]|uniref:N-acetyltransferase domain-containing protein n=1 Tax=Thiosulfatimonas sediminis TaxID=2675054 RepID=A0A6F8PRE7_9GAMM|nr:GNAT family protein [Thiosulfatimonas sediminis]BBP44656.1 hypothetical protein THMIRHAS_00290 [Thiosulfatimonas sediminis]